MNLKRYLNHLKKAGQTKAKIIFGVFKALLGSDPPHLFSGKKVLFRHVSGMAGRKEMNCQATTKYLNNYWMEYHEFH